MTSDVTNDLKPCPFCGRIGKIHSFNDSQYRVECTNSFCQASYMIGMDFDTEDEAIEAWNRRITDDK